MKPGSLDHPLKPGSLVKPVHGSAAYFGYGIVTDTYGRHQTRVLWIDDGEDEWEQTVHLEVVYEPS